MGVDRRQKYEPFWSAVFAVKFDDERVRDDFVKTMNEIHKRKFEKPLGERSSILGPRTAPRMAWREGTTFHLVNLSSFLQIKPEEVIDGWRRGIEAAKNHQLKDPADACLYGTLVSLFDEMRIHSMESDAIGVKWTDHVTAIVTGRRLRSVTPRRPRKW